MYSKIKLQLSTNGRKTSLRPSLSYDHYLAHIELFECTVSEVAHLDFSCEEPAFFMYAMLHNNSCSLNYIRRGSFSEPVYHGQHKIVIIKFRLEWLIYKLQRMDPLNSLSMDPYQYTGHFIRFPTLKIAGMIFKSFNKMSSVAGDSKRDDEGYNFVNGCINKYYNRLISKHNTQIFHDGKVEKVRNFIDENYNKSVADDMPRLAEKFMLSERSLARIAKLAFGIPLHEQVIKLRIHAGFRQLTVSDKPIYEIARQTGYNDPHYFSKAFKKHFGVSPKCVRRPAMQLIISDMQG